MVASTAARTGVRGETLVVDLPFPGEGGAAPFTRADVVITGVEHAGPSFEVRLFLDNADATVATARTPEQSYAGRFTVFGHGGCYGEDDHCAVPDRSTDPTDLRPDHPLRPLDTFVTITEALLRLLDGGGTLHTVTLVPLSLVPRRADRGPAPELLVFRDVSLQTYLGVPDP